MKYLCNIYDPKQPDAKNKILTEANETQEQAWQRHLKWLEDKAIGEPKSTRFYTVKELKEMGMVGLYMKDD